MNVSVLTRRKFPRFTNVHTVVLFDGDTGAIHHVHCALLFEGQGTSPSPELLEAVARRNLARRQTNRKLPELEALHIPNAGLAAGPHRVDLGSRKVVTGSRVRSPP